MSCLTPYVLSDKKTYMNHGKTIAVPCGKCPACFRRRISGWSFRLMQEEKNSECAHFITLTYDTDHVPISGKRYMDLSKRDVQLFFKRLRKAQSRIDRCDGIRCLRKLGMSADRGIADSRIKYFAVGEYGGKTNRPHYHAIVFGADIKAVESAWQLGQVHFGKVTEASVGYTLKYMIKPSKIPLHANDDRQKEFQLMSKGLGRSYFQSEAMVGWHKENLQERMYCNLKDGKKIAMPRYYKDKIYSLEERSFISGYHKGLREKESDDYEFNTPGKVKQQIVASHKAQFGKMLGSNQKRNKI